MIEKLQARVAALKEKGVTPKLGIIRCGENPSDLSYERGATKRAGEIGVEVEKFVLPEDVTKEALIAEIEKINADDSIHGVLMFRPLPKHLKADQDEICNKLDPSEGHRLHDRPVQRRRVHGQDARASNPAPRVRAWRFWTTTESICKGKNAVVIGRSLVIGKPVAMMLMAKNATITDLPHEDRERSRDRQARGHRGLRGGRAGLSDEGLTSVPVRWSSTFP